jgi:hypothetical protein
MEAMGGAAGRGDHPSGPAVRRTGVQVFLKEEGTHLQLDTCSGCKTPFVTKGTLQMSPVATATAFKIEGFPKPLSLDPDDDLQTAE